MFGSAPDLDELIGPDGKFKMLSGEELIAQSIRNIMITHRNEMIMNPSQGSRVSELLFDLNDEAFQDMMKVYLVEDLQAQEPRIKVLSVNITPEDNIARVQVRYQIIDTNIRGSAVVEVNNG